MKMNLKQPSDCFEPSIWRQIGRVIRLSLILCISLAALSSVAMAQAKDDKDPPEPPEPEDITLRVNDGRDGTLVLHATYYPSDLGKEAVPIVMLHDYKGSRHDFDKMALDLQRQLGHAVIVPDLRGHGDSTQYETPLNAPPTFRAKKIDKDRMNKNDFVRMVKGDLEAVRKFLISENNAAKLNLNKLCVVGAGMGSVMALNWTYVDWTAPTLSIGKQGQDIKGLVLISPQWNFRGLPIQTAIQHEMVRSKVSIVFVYGEQNASAKRDAQRLYAHFKPMHPGADADAPVEDRDLFDFGLKTKVQSTALLDEDTLRVTKAVAQFIDLRLVQQDFAWSERKVIGN